MKQVSSFTSQKRTRTLQKRAYILASAAIVLSLAFCQAAVAQSVATYQEPFRPQFHYTPAMNWMNDPNGLPMDGSFRCSTFRASYFIREARPVLAFEIPPN